MKLDEYSKSRGIPLTEIARRSGVSYQTVKRVSRGYRLDKYDKAKSISDACDGVVTVKELCE